jgi:hypothetical protein
MSLNSRKGGKGIGGGIGVGVVGVDAVDVVLTTFDRRLALPLLDPEGLVPSCSVLVPVEIVSAFRSFCGDLFSDGGDSLELG